MPGRTYAPEYNARIVELVRTGRSADRLALEFEPSATAIRRWVEQADLNQGRRTGGLATAERKEVCESKRELRRVRLERDITEKATARPPLRGGAPRGRADRSPEGIPVRMMCRLPGLSPGRVLRVAESGAVGAGACECDAHRGDRRDPRHERRPVRGTAGPRRVEGAGPRGDREPGRPADANSGDRGCVPVPEWQDDEAGRELQARAGPLAAVSAEKVLAASRDHVAKPLCGQRIPSLLAIRWSLRRSSPDGCA